ncbi:MAG: L-histidine N(alpha)-methyltransferase [Gammaproteobacteria bacterium]
MPQVTVRAAPVRLLDLHPPAANFARDVLTGLSASPKWMSPMYFYDAEGSRLFDLITELPEYYPTRAELEIMDAFMPEIAARLGPRACVIEFGSGSGLKTRQLLRGLDRPVAYVPVEISRDHLMASANELAAEFPAIEVLPVCADFTAPFELPEPSAHQARNVVFFPGSTIGNFAMAEAEQLLKVMHTEAGSGGALLIGVDLRKDRSTVEAAYNDAAGVTARFNLNLLKRINRELNADFDVDTFSHRADWNAEAGRIEMRLISDRSQRISVNGTVVEFAAGETLLTEYSHKYELREFAELAARAGWRVEQVWTDAESLFSVQCLARD